MRLLLDTHIWLWAALEPDRLQPSVQRALIEADERWLSPVTVWETLLLAERGRLDLGTSPAEWIQRQLRAAPMRDAPLDRETALASRSVALPHEDPADRFLAATAMVRGLTLVTADRRLLDAAGVPTLAYE